MANYTGQNAALLDEFLEYLRDLNKRPSTIYCYDRSLSSLVAHVGGVSLASVSADVLRGWVNAPSVKPGFEGMETSATTRKRKISEVRSFFKWLQTRKKIVVENPSLELDYPEVPKHLPRPVPVDQWRALWASDLDDSLRVALGLSYFCGLRRFEVTDLTPWHFQDLPSLRLVQFRRKGGDLCDLSIGKLYQLHARRAPELVGDPEAFPAALARLRASRPADALRVLPWREERQLQPMHRIIHEQPDGHINPDIFNKRLRLALKAVGLPEFAFGVHGLRHSFGTNAMRLTRNNIVLVAQWMNHSSIEVTRGYISVGEDDLDALLADEPETPKRKRASRW